MAVGVAAVVLPYTAVGALFGFVHLGGGFLWPLALVVVSYIACAEIVKREYYRRVAL